jgi:hypothetical protein
MNRIIIQTTSCLVGIFLLFGGNAYAACPDPGAFPFNDCSLPGIRDGSYPYFDQGIENVEYKRSKKYSKNGKFSLKAKGENMQRSQFLIDLDNVFDIDKTLKVNVNKKGVAKGKVKIKGIIDEFGMKKKKTLMKAKLEGGWTLSDDGLLFGVNTHKIICKHLPVPCTKAESVYLALKESLNDAISGEKFKTDAIANTDAIAVTTVPIPAAAWLFGSGLLALAGIARKRRNTG